MAQSLERRNLIERLHAGAVTARRVPSNGIITDHHNSLELTGIKRKQLAIVLQENNGFPGNLQGGSLVASGISLAGRAIQIKDPRAKHGP
jgi:hypothetical protein